MDYYDTIERKLIRMLDRLSNVIAPPIRDHRIYFMHIPKCAGTSVGKAIADCYKPWRLDGWTRIARLDSRALIKASAVSGKRKGMLAHDLLRYSMASTKNRLILGHLPFCEKAHREFSGTWKFVTVLRDPVARWLSNYSYTRSLNSPFGHELDITEFMELPGANWHGHAVVTYMTGEWDDDKCRSPEVIQEAIRWLQEFDLVGRVEDLEDFRKRFEHLFGKRLYLAHSNVTSGKKKRGIKDLDPALLAKIRQICDPDLQVYNTLFGQPTSVHCLGPRGLGVSNMHEELMIRS